MDYSFMRGVCGGMSARSGILMNKLKKVANILNLLFYVNFVLKFFPLKFKLFQGMINEKL
jgi:hypothetical protein